MLFIFRQSDVFCYGSGLMDPSKMRIECMNKKQFIDSITQIWEVLEVRKTLDHLESIFISQENKVSTAALRALARWIQFNALSFSNLDQDAKNLFLQLDAKDLFKADLNNPLVRIADWLNEACLRVETSNNTKVTYIQRGQIISNKDLAEYYALVLELSTSYQIAQKLASEYAEYHSDSLVRIKFSTLEHQNTGSLIEFLNMLEESILFLCKHYGVDYEPAQIVSVETGSLDFVLALPPLLCTAIEGAQGIINFAGVVFTVLNKYHTLKVSVQKGKQAELETLIKEQELKKAESNAAKAEQERVNSLLQGAIHVIDLGRKRGALDNLEMAQAIEVIKCLAPEDLAEKAESAMLMLLSPEKQEVLALPPGSEKAEAEPDEGKSEAELAEEELDAELEDRLNREP